MKKRFLMVLILAAGLVSCNNSNVTTSSSSSSALNSSISSSVSSSSSSSVISSIISTASSIFSSSSSSSGNSSSSSSFSSSSLSSSSISSSSTSVSSSSSSTSSSFSSSSSSSDEDDYTTPEGRKSIFDKAEVGDPSSYAIGRVVKIEEFKYNENINVYLQDGKYTYQAINVSSYDVEIGKDYMVYGKKKSSPSYGYRIDCAGDVAISMIGMEEMYGVVEPIFPSVDYLDELTYFPAIIDLADLAISNKDNISISSSFDKYSFGVTKGDNTYTIECQKGKDEGLALVNFVYNLPLGTSISLNDVVVFSNNLCRITSVDDISLNMSDEERIAKVKDELIISSELENDISLPSSKMDCEIFWESSNEKYLTNTGKVTRPAFGEGDVTVTLVATIKYNNAQDTKVFSIKVKAETDDEVYSDPFISVYVEGSGNNKVLGIKNPGNDTLNLSGYSVKAVTSSNAKSYSLSGTLSSGDTLYLINKAASFVSDFEKTTHLVLANDVVNFNGDDAICLYKDGVLIDIIGDLVNKPSSGWTISGNVTTKDHTLVRSSSIKKGNTTFNTAEWVGYDKDNIDFLN